jgi:uncharacterized Tic20 family protein
MDEPMPPIPPPAAALPPPSPGMTSDEKLWAIGCHLSIFLGVPFILPLIVFLVKREESALIAAHAREALNFHLSLLLYAVCCLPFFFFLFCIPLMVLPPIWLAGFILAIIAAVKASEGGFFKYPLTIPFLG